MHNEFTCIIEKDEDWFIAYCPEIPGANGQGRTAKECRKSLSEAIALILKDNREGGRHSLWCNPETGHTEAVPRHTEIPNKLVKKICRELSIKAIG